MEHCLTDPGLLKTLMPPRDVEPVLIGRGGAQFVYKFPGMDEVIKIDYATLSQPEINGDVLTARTPRPDFHPVAQSMLALRTSIRQVAKKCLGKEAFLNEQTSFIQLPLTGKICRKLWGSAPYADTDVRWFRTFMTIQDEAKPIVHPERYGTVPLCVQAYERSGTRSFDPELYGSAMRRWVSCTDKTPWQESDWDTLTQLDGASIGGLRTLVEKPAFRQALRRYIEGSIDFSNITGQHIDTGSNDNVVLYQDNDEVRYLAVDPLIPFGDDSLGYVRNGIHASLDKVPIDNYTAMWMYNAMGSVRCVNALAQALSISKRIKMSNRPTFIDDNTWARIFASTQNVRFQGKNFPTQWHTTLRAPYETPVW